MSASGGQLHAHSRLKVRQKPIFQQLSLSHSCKKNFFRQNPLMQKPPPLPSATKKPKAPSVKALSDLREIVAPDMPGAASAEIDEILAARDPTHIGFPAMLPVELALKLDKPGAICAAYGVTKEMFAGLLANAAFVKAYRDAVELVKLEGMSFKLKARMQAEELLKTSYMMVKNGNTSDAVRADLIKSTVRWAGWDAKAAEAGAGSSFAIQINLG